MTCGDNLEAVNKIVQRNDELCEAGGPIVSGSKDQNVAREYQRTVRADRVMVSQQEMRSQVVTSKFIVEL